jgi:hypothetical protein
MLRRFIWGVVVLPGLSAPTAARAELVTNGNFDADSPPGQTAPMGWILTDAASGADFFVGPGPGFGAFSPTNSANFGAVGALDDTLSQTLSTVAGQSYTLTYELAHDSTNSANDFSVSWDGAVIPGSALVNAGSFGYTQFTFTVTASSASTVLAFSGRENPAWYDLDNVSVVEAASAVPEPSTLALLALGGTGWAGWRRWKGKRGTAAA